MTILLEILVVAAVIFGAVAYALGHVDGLRPAPPDSGEIGLPAGPVSAAAIERTRFGLAFRGYRMAEVDGVLDRLRDEIARRDEELAATRDGAEPSGLDAPSDTGPARGHDPGHDSGTPRATGTEDAGLPDPSGGAGHLDASDGD